MHNETLPAKTEVILVFLIDDKIGLLRVSMGLTDRRKTAKNLVDSRKN